MTHWQKLLMILVPLNGAILLCVVQGKITALQLFLLFAAWIATKVEVRE